MSRKQRQVRGRDIRMLRTGTGVAEGLELGSTWIDVEVFVLV